jgi:hypothetical protein
MKIAATLTLLLALPGIRFTPSPKVPEPQARKSSQTAIPAHGQWYLAQSGHAVYCYGPVLTMPDVQSGLHRVATFCRGNQPMVPLKD